MITLWVTQVVLAATFIFAGGSKLLGAPAMVDLFNAIGFGEWFRYLTGAIEISGAVMLLIPSAAVFGAMLLVPTMIGAVATNLSLGQSTGPTAVSLDVRGGCRMGPAGSASEFVLSVIICSGMQQGFKW